MSPRLDIRPPLLSVIVPVYNSPLELAQCLTALAESDYDDFEVIVVDDGSTPPVAPLVRTHGYTCHQIDGPGGPARARNRGAALAAGGYVVFIDADVCVHRHTLSRLAARFEAEPELDAVIGTYDDTPAVPTFLSQYKNLFHRFIHRRHAGPVSTFWSGCGAMRRDLFMAFNGFDETRYRRPAIEDIELGTWLSAAGYRIVLDAHIEVKHLKRWTFWGLLKADVIDRGIPWTRLMLRAGSMVRTLNVASDQRLSVGLVYAALVLVLAAAWWPPAVYGALGLSLVLTLVNLDFYRFFYDRRGLWFTLRVLPLHWLYFGYCGLSVVCGAWLHVIGSSTENKTNDDVDLT